MTIKEVCEKYDVTESTLKNQFKRTQAKILKQYGITIIKIGRGISAEYVESIDTQNRAVTLYDENPQNLICLDEEIIGLANWELAILSVLLARPELVYRGTIKQLAQYLRKPTSANNLGAIELAIRSLKDKGHIIMAEDDMEGYFILGLKRKSEKALVEIQTGLIKEFYDISEVNNKRDWIPLLKVYAGAILLHPEEPYTMDKLVDLLNLPEYTIRETKKLLDKNDIIKFNKEYQDGTYFCKGTSADINKIH